LLLKDNEDGTVWCIEGNTSTDKKGSQRNGGQVSKKLRAFRKNKQGEMISIVGFGRPKFKGGANLLHHSQQLKRKFAQPAVNNENL
jgi:hypothetical protein